MRSNPAVLRSKRSTETLQIPANSHLRCPLSADSKVVEGSTPFSGTKFNSEIQEPLIRYDLHSTAEYPIVCKLAATPVHPPVALSLSIDGERSEPRRLILSLEPAVSDHTLVVFPLAGKFVMLRHSKDVGILVGPDFAVTGDGVDLADCEKSEIEDGFEYTQAILNVGPILEDLHPPLVDNNVCGLTNFQREFCSYHLR